MEFIAFLNVQFVTESQITQAPAVIVSHVVAERNIFLLLSCELRVDNGHYEVLLSVEEYGRGWLVLQGLFL
jgi:hypothetical protein